MLHAALMPWLGGADVVVVGEAHAVPQAAKFARHLRRKLLRSFAGLGRRPLNLLSMLVGTGQKQHVEAAHALPSRHRIRRHRRVRVAQMRPGIHVVDRRGEVKRRFRILLFFLDWHEIGVQCSRKRLESESLSSYNVLPLRLRESDPVAPRARSLRDRARCIHRDG